MKYGVGDRVQIKSLDWYNENKTGEFGNIDCGAMPFVNYMTKFCNKIVTISNVNFKNKYYDIEEDGATHGWTDEMIEGLVEEEVPYDTEYKYLKHEITLPDGYIFKDENGNVINATKIVLEKKKKEYPKTYEECCKIIHSDPKFYVDTHLYSGILGALYKLLICRDAYWKLYGEEMGLGKPWKPKLDNNEKIYYIHNVSGKVYECEGREIENQIFAFPTPEMRDAFKENFDPDIEICKEFL